MSRVNDLQAVEWSSIEETPHSVNYNRFGQLRLSEQKQKLPIFRARNLLLQAIENYEVVIIVGETGCGKSTQIPQYLHEAGWTVDGRCVVCTQPRRFAAISIASRVAEEMETPVGELVGYAVRHNYNFSVDKTVIKYCTDGLLVRESMADALLSKYSVVMVDEAHERSLQTDILLGILKKILLRRNHLPCPGVNDVGHFRIIVASATLEAAKIKQFFDFNLTSDSSRDNAIIIPVEGRLNPVDLHYLKSPCRNYISCANETVRKICILEGTSIEGDILVFMPGIEEILMLVEMLDGLDVEVVPFHSSLPVKQQAKVFNYQRDVRRVVIATNIAETSLTLPHIKYVVDCGFSRQSHFDLETFCDYLVTVPVSKAQAVQRSGRAGRLKEAGHCFRLYTEASFSDLNDASTPEILRSNLSWAVLQLKALGVDDIMSFDFLSNPSLDSLVAAMDLLISLDAIDIDTGELTWPTGEYMAELSLDPKLSKMLLKSHEFHCGEEGLTIASILSLTSSTIFKSIYRDNMKKYLDEVTEFVSIDGDLITALRAFNDFSSSSSSSSSSACMDVVTCRLAVNVRQKLKYSFQGLKKLKSKLSHVNSDENDRKKPRMENWALESCGQNDEPIKKAIVAGYFPQSAKLGSNGKYSLIRGNSRNDRYSGTSASLELHPSCFFNYFVGMDGLPEWIVFAELIHNGNNRFARNVTRINPRWLIELAPHYFTCQR